MSTKPPSIAFVIGGFIVALLVLLVAAIAIFGFPGGDSDIPPVDDQGDGSAIARRGSDLLGELQNGSSLDALRVVGGTSLDDEVYFIETTRRELLEITDEGSLNILPLQPPRAENPLRAGDVLGLDEETLLVSDFANGQIWLYERSGRFKEGFLSTEQRQESRLMKPMGLALDGEERLLVVDAADHRLKIFSKEGQLLGSFGGEGTKTGKFNFPNDVVATEDGEIIVSDSNNRRIQRFDSSGRFLGAFSETDQGGSLELPRSLGIDGEGRIHVADTLGARVHVFTTEGRFVASYGSGSGGQPALSFPEGLYVRGDEAFVGERGKGIAVFSLLNGSE